MQADHRSRLIEAIAQAVTEKGFAHTTIADVARHARVSKRTFYEHFADKEACFLAAYAAHSERMLHAIGSAVQHEPEVEARLDKAIAAYIATLREQPALTRAFLREIQAAGPAARKLRRELHGRFAEQLRTLVEVARQQRPELTALSPAMATALVGGIDSLLLLSIERAGVRDLNEVAETARELIRAVLEPRAPGSAVGPRRARPAARGKPKRS